MQYRLRIGKKFMQYLQLCLEEKYRCILTPLQVAYEGRQYQQYIQGFCFHDINTYSLSV
ncbi:hypothetical protein D3C72_1185370 [compost metagenome]